MYDIFTLQNHHSWISLLHDSLLYLGLQVELRKNQELMFINYAIATMTSVEREKT